MKQIATIIVSALLLIAGRAAAQSGIYLRVDGINGFSTITTPDGKKLVDVTAVSGGVSQEIHIGDGTGTGAGKAQPGAISFTLANFQDAAAFKKLFFTATPAATAYFIFTTAGATSIASANNYYVIALANVMPLEINESCSSGEAATVQVSLTYSKATYYYRKQNPDGSLVIEPLKSPWNFVTNNNANPVPLPANY